MSSLLTDNLISHWKLDTGSGVTATDSVGSNHGTLMTINYVFTVSGITTAPTAGAVYTSPNAAVFTVISTSLTGTPKAGTITCSGSTAPDASGNLTKVSGTGDATIAYSAFTGGVATWGAPSNSQIKYTNPYCLTFNGSSQYVDDGNTGAHGITGSFSISVWINGNSLTSGNSKIIVSKDPGSGTSNRFFYLAILNTGKTYFQVLDASNGATNRVLVNSNTVLNSSQWYHIAAIYNATTYTGTIYINGVSNASNTSPGAFTITPSNGNSLKIGQAGSINWFNGSIDDVRIYSRDLGADEVLALYTAEARADGTEADFHRTLLERGLVGYWRFDEGSGSNATDGSGFGNPATLVSSPTWSASVPTVKFYNPYCISFNGSNQYARTTTSPVNGLTAISISVWFNRTGTGSLLAVLTNAYDHAGPEIGITETTIAFPVYNGRGAYYDDLVVSGLTLNTGTWYHVVATWKSDHTMSVYLNGVLQSGSYSTAGTKPTSVGNYNVFFGVSGALGLAGYFNGSIDDVRIYNRILTQSEITLLAGGANPATQIFAGTIYAGTIN